MPIRFQFPGTTAAAWTASNPVLLARELGIETDTHKFKIGDGITSWNSLPYGGVQGNTGAPGPAAPQGIQVTAGTTLSGNHVVIVDTDGKAYPADCTTSAHLDKPKGITTTAVQQGSPVTVQTFGIMTEPGWNWNYGPIFIGLQGSLVQTPPTTGFILQIGKAVNPTTINIAQEPGIVLAA